MREDDPSADPGPSPLRPYEAPEATFPGFLFQCPRTGMMTRAELAPPPARADDRTIYAGIQCSACGTFHLINPKTGKLIAEERRGH